MAGNAERWRQCHRRPRWCASRGGSRASQPASRPLLRSAARRQARSFRGGPGRRAHRRGYLRLVRVCDMNDISESPPQSAPQDISLLAMAAFIRRHIRIIGGCVLLAGIAAGAASFLLTPRYRAEVVFSPVNSGSLSSELGGSLGGLAAI